MISGRKLSEAMTPDHGISEHILVPIMMAVIQHSCYHRQHSQILLRFKENRVADINLRETQEMGSAPMQIDLGNLGYT